MSTHTVIDRNESYTTELVRNIFAKAVAMRSSDVHIDPTPTGIRIRFRVDGAMIDQGELPLQDHIHIMTRLKVLSELDITALPIPQDGHFEMNLDDLHAEGPGNPAAAEAFRAGNLAQIANEVKPIIDIRISLFPTVNGEAAVCRLLNRSEALFSIDELGFDPDTLTKVRKLTKRSYGMLLVTGPVGAGKTTTLYSLIKETMGAEKNVVTLEDPVEFRFSTIRQIQMQPERGMTFAVGMKSILRQDPDIIMIGEIRDAETAEHATRASLVGRIVFSTIHSNTTIGTIARLLDMGIEKSLIAYAINGVISSRLVRKNCEFCRVNYTPSSEYLLQFGLDASKTQFWKGAGCDHCNGTGYNGRTGIFEVLEFDKTLRSMIVDGASMADLQQFVENNGLRSLTQDAMEKVAQGVTTIENVAHMI